MKGLAISVELLVVLIVAVVVLLAVVLFYYGGWIGTKIFNVETGLNMACTVVTSNFCSDAIWDNNPEIRNVDLDRNGNDDTLQSICLAAGVPGKTACFKRCLCSVD